MNVFKAEIRQAGTGIGGGMLVIAAPGWQEAQVEADRWLTGMKGYFILDGRPTRIQHLASDVKRPRVLEEFHILE
jgi:hypothetical protein